MTQGAPDRPGRARASFAFFCAQVCAVLALPIVLCAYLPELALAWFGVVVIAMLGFALLHSGWSWLVPIMGALSVLSLTLESPNPRSAYLAASTVLAALVAAFIIRSEVRQATDDLHGERAEGSPADGGPVESTVSARIVDGAVLVSWLPPSTSGGSPITGYHVQASHDAGLTWAPIQEVAGDVLEAFVTGLPGGREVSFRVAAANEIGLGPASQPTAPVTPMGPAGPPLEVMCEPADGQVRLTWNPPVSDGGHPITDYVVQVSGDDGASWVLAPRIPSTDCIAVITGLVNGVAYRFNVRAVNAGGVGDESSSGTATPAGLPGAPVLRACTPGDRSITVEWAPPASDGGMPLLGYVVESSHDGGGTWVLNEHPEPEARSVSLVGLAYGLPFIVRVAAVNAVGRGPASEPSLPLEPMGVPGEVGGVEASVPSPSPGDGEAVPNQSGGRRQALLSRALVVAVAVILGLWVALTMQSSAFLGLSEMSAAAQGQVSAAPATPDAPPPPLPALDALNCLPEQAAASGPSSSAAGGDVLGRLAFTRGSTALLSPGGYDLRLGTSADVLAAGFGHLPVSALPGAAGNTIVRWSSRADGLVGLATLQAGDEIAFTGKDATVDRYVVDSTLLAAPEEAWFMGNDPLQTARPAMTIAACEMTAGKRLVIVARLSPAAGGQQD